MSQQNMETVRRHNEAWNGRKLTAWLGLFRSDAAIDWSRSRGPLKGVYCGQGRLKTFWDEFWSTFQDVQVEMHEFTEVGSEVVVANTAHMRGREGIEVIARGVFVFTVENEAITRFSDVPSASRSTRSRGTAGVGRGLQLDPRGYQQRVRACFALHSSEGRSHEPG
jgi:ketosteroid isomerase-like protein